MNVLLLALCYMLVNLPFGYLRAGVPKKSPEWFLYIHLPIPFVVALRIWVFQVSWEFIPLLVLCYALGQWGGGRLRTMGKKLFLFLSMMFLVLLGVWAEKISFSEHAASHPTPAHSASSHPASSHPASATSFKISGVVKKVESVGLHQFRLVVRGESGSEKTVLLSSETPLLSEGQPLPLGALKVGDVVDLDCDSDPKSPEPRVRKATVIVSTASLDALPPPDLSEDPEFE